MHRTLSWLIFRDYVEVKYKFVDVNIKGETTKILHSRYNIEN